MKEKCYNCTMKKFLTTILCMLFFCGLANSQTVYATEVQAIADVKVYVVEAQSLADLVVYKANSSIYPGINQNEGIWYFTNNQIEADKIITYVQSPALADLKIYFTTVPMIAGWQNPQKKYLMSSNNN